MSEEKKPIRVVDRRMFTPEGELRPEFQAEESSEPPLKAPEPSAEAARPVPPRERPEAEGRAAPEGEPRTEFAAIVRSLATTAYAALGLLPDPATGARHRDPAVARQMIDWLALLERKTRGNLSFEESDFLSRVLYELRLSYVEALRSPAP